ncbi:MAG: hypothetical protein NZ554_14255 [Bryobacteraceae bacterium]|nr:hypothetical protein [Bryobacteraceae bacterium]
MPPEPYAAPHAHRSQQTLRRQAVDRLHRDAQGVRYRIGLEQASLGRLRRGCLRAGRFDGRLGPAGALGLLEQLAGGEQIALQAGLIPTAAASQGARLIGQGQHGGKDHRQIEQALRGIGLQLLAGGRNPFGLLPQLPDALLLALLEGEQPGTLGLIERRLPGLPLGGVDLLAQNAHPIEQGLPVI